LFEKQFYLHISEIFYFLKFDFRIIKFCFLLVRNSIFLNENSRLCGGAFVHKRICLINVIIPKDLGILSIFTKNILS